MDALQDLFDRTIRAADRLTEVAEIEADRGRPDEAARLKAKAAGVRLVLGYIVEAKNCTEVVS